MEYTEVLTLIRKVARAVNLESKRIEKIYGISIPQLLCLKFLSGRPQFQASQKEIKDYLSLNASTVTGIIARLERKGLIAKLPRRDDRRLSHIVLTARGAQLIQTNPLLVHEQLAEGLKKMPPEELAKLKSAFANIAALIDTQTPETPTFLIVDSEYLSRTD
jgi:DNA-binding MarR family transcriptional regulator